VSEPLGTVAAGEERRVRRGGSGRRPVRTRIRTRRIHLVDVENLVGHARLTRDDVRACATAYRGLDLVGARDLLVLGCNPGEQLAVGLGWGGPHRLVVRHGPDGADLALLDVLGREHVERRFDDLVIASGDGVFADEVRRLRGRGLHVTVVAPVRSAARRLRRAAGRALVPFPSLGDRGARATARELVPAA